jgi:hypothetical protein
MADEIVERWLPIKGFEGYYSVSSEGRVRAELRRVPHGEVGHVTRKQRILKHWYVTCGYATVDLVKHRVHKSAPVHLLVLQTFVGERPEGAQGCHNNGDRKDPRLINLRWDTPAKNQQDRVAHGTSNRGERCGQAKLTADQAIAISRDPRPIRALAAEYGVSHETIRWVKVGKSWSHVTRPEAHS